MEHNADLGQNVISMFGYKTETLFPAIKQIEAYWESLRSGRIVPQRSEIDPGGIESALEYTFVLERIAPGLGRFRLAGMHLNNLLGMEVRGMPFTSFFTPAARRIVTSTLEKVFDGPQTAELTSAAERAIGKPPMDAKVILLPLRCDQGEITCILGCLISLGPIGRVPRRFDVLDAKMKPLTSYPARNAVTAKSPVPGFAEHSAPITGSKIGEEIKKGSDDNRPTLRLVVSID